MQPLVAATPFVPTTLRDWFAGQVLAGMFAGGSVKLPFVEGYETGDKEAAARAYRFADAMLAERDRVAAAESK